MLILPLVFQLHRLYGTWVGASRLICPIWPTSQQCATFRVHQTRSAVFRMNACTDDIPPLDGKIKRDILFYEQSKYKWVDLIGCR